MTDNIIQQIRQLLQSIIDNDGECIDMAITLDCKDCPISKMANRSDGSRLSCVSVVQATDSSTSSLNAKYKNLAEKLLIDLEIEEILLRGNNNE